MHIRVQLKPKSRPATKPAPGGAADDSSTLRVRIRDTLIQSSQDGRLDAVLRGVAAGLVRLGDSGGRRGADAALVARRDRARPVRPARTAR